MLNFSVVIPTYNRAELVTRAVKSALEQVEPGDEIIVVDDGSTDDTEAQLGQFGNLIHYIKIKNSGAGAARNRGISAASRDLIAFLDSDDEWMPGKLALHRALFESSAATFFAFSDFASKDSEGRISRNHLKTWHLDPRPWEEILGNRRKFSEIAPLPEGIEDFDTYCGDLSLCEMRSAYVFTSTVVARRLAAKHALVFAEDVPTFEDLECWGRLALTGDAFFLATDTAWQHGESPDRLSERNTYDKSFSRVTVLERVWGNHEGFLAKHAQPFSLEVHKARLQLATELLILGRPAEARRELAKLTAVPLAQRILSHFPGFLTRIFFTIRKKLKGIG